MSQRMVRKISGMGPATITLIFGDTKPEKPALQLPTSVDISFVEGCAHQRKI